MLETQVEVRSRRGIDLSPVDVTTEHGARLLRAFIWPGRVERAQRLRKAIEILRREPPVLVRGDYVELLPALLAERDDSALTVVFQTASTGYLHADRRAELRELLEDAGREGPLGWISTRADRGAGGEARRQLRARDRPLARRQAALPAPLRLPRELDQVARVISSASNPRLKLVRKLGLRRQREKLGLFAAEGEDLVAAALEGGWELEFALVDAERPPALECRRGPSRWRRSCSRRSRGSATRRGSSASSGLRGPERERPELGLELWQVRDPGNVGTLARAADAFGGYLALSEGCADPFGPKALRASTGVDLPRAARPSSRRRGAWRCSRTARRR